MEPRKLRGSERCEKCQTNMEVHLTYHKCPVCGAVKKKGGRTYRDRTAESGNKPPDLLQRIRSSTQAATSVSGTPGSAEFLQLELTGSLLLERYILLGCLLLFHSGLYLQILLGLRPAPMQAGWPSPASLGWLPLLLTLLTTAVVLHTDAQVRRVTMLTAGVFALACLLVAIFAYGPFSRAILTAYPGMDMLMVIGSRHGAVWEASGPAYWLALHGGWFAFAAWHIHHEDREQGR